MAGVAISQDNFINPRQKKPRRPKGGISTSVSLGAEYFTRLPRDITGVHSVSDLLLLLRKVPPDISYYFGIHFPRVDHCKTLLTSVVDLLVGLHLDPNQQILHNYLQSLENRTEFANPFHELEAVLSKFYEDANAKLKGPYKSTCDKMLNRLSASEGRASTFSGPDFELATQALKMEKRQLRDFLGKSGRRFRTLMREISHSWRNLELVYRRSFHGHTRNFAPMQTKLAPMLYRDPSLFRLQNCHPLIKCKLVKVANESSTVCHIGKNEMIIQGIATVKFSEVEYIFTRIRDNRECAFEFFVKNGNSFLIDFAPRTAKEILVCLRSSRIDGARFVQRDSAKQFFKKYGETQKWLEWGMTNFEYLLRLNIFASRTFRDPSSYPIFPWILKNFDNFDPADPTIFRDFASPISCESPLPSDERSVAYWLIRLPPFTYLSSEGSSVFTNFAESLEFLQNSGLNWELVPEFFCQPESLGPVGELQISPLVLPYWCQGSMDFVYLHRKLLESDHVSSQLHKWIELVFDLFDGPHEPRPARPQHRTIKQGFSVCLDRPGIVFCSLVWIEEELKYVCILRDGSVLLLLVQYHASLRTASIGQLGNGSIVGFAKFPAGVFVTGQKNYHIRANGIDDVGKSPEEIELLAASENQIVFCGRNGGVWHANLRDLGCSEAIAPIFYEKPVTMAVSCGFDLLVVGTMEGNVLMHSLHSGLFRTRNHLDGEIPVRILITEGWGFVLVDTKKNIYLFNVNGLKIRVVQPQMEVVAWSTWKDVRGFDFLAVADEKGRVFVSEAFYLSFGEPTTLCRGLVIELAYVNEYIGLSAVTEDGRIYLIPLPESPALVSQSDFV
jgi:hypothetical protein